MKFNGFDKSFIVFLILCNAGLFYYFGTGFNKGDWVVIEVDAKRVSRFPLRMDHVAHVQGPLGTTEVEIENGRARIVLSPCKLKVWMLLLNNEIIELKYVEVCGAVVDFAGLDRVPQCCMVFF